MYRTMVIGVAGRGRIWANAVMAHPQFELVAMADLDAEAMKVCADAVGATNVAQYTDFHEAFAGDGIDVVVNAAATTAHFPITRDVIEAGVHCLVEKPFTLDIEQAETLVDLAAQHKVTLAVAQNYRFTALCRFVAGEIATGKLGDLLEVTGQFYRNRPPRPSDKNIAFPMLFIQGVHHLDWIASVAPGELQLIKATHHLPADSQWTSPTVCHVQMTSDGAPITYTGSYDARGAMSSYAGVWRFSFAKGDLVIDNDENVWLECDTPDGPTHEKVYAKGGDEPAGEALLLDTMHAGIAEGIEPPTSGRANVAVLKLLFDICAQHAE